MQVTNDETLGKRIVRLREKLGLKQIELADKSGIGRRTICDYENEKSIPDSYNVKQIAKVLGVTVDYLLGASNIESPSYLAISPTEFEYALYDEIKDLTKEEKRIILSVARGIKDGKRNF